MGRLIPLVEIIINREQLRTFEEIYNACDKLGYNLGAIISGFMEFH